MSSKYWMQTQAPAGNWTDSIGSSDKESCMQHGKYRAAVYGDAVRVVERVDVTLWSLDVPTYSKRTQAAIAKYGQAACVRAAKMCDEQGMGARSVSIEGPSSIKTTQQADAAINAGREILKLTGYKEQE